MGKWHKKFKGKFQGQKTQKKPPRRMVFKYDSDFII